MEKIETIMYKGIQIDAYYDEDAQSPDEWGNDECFLVYDHRDFEVERKGFDPGDIFEVMQEGKRLYKGFYYFPVYAYIHSGVSLSLGRTGWPFNCPWDTSFKGFAMIKKQRGCYDEDKARNMAEGLIEEWNQCLSGDVYGYMGEDLMGCWGYYGKEGYKQMIEDAKGEIDSIIETKIKEHNKQVKAWIINKVPLYARLSFAV